MPGGLMQLSAYGAQDFYLTGNPQISYFKTDSIKYSSRTKTIEMSQRT